MKATVDGHGVEGTAEECASRLSQRAGSRQREWTLHVVPLFLLSLLDHIGSIPFLPGGPHRVHLRVTQPGAVEGSE